MTDEEYTKRINLAVDNFVAGYGCAQSVFAAFSDLYGLDDVIVVNSSCAEVASISL